LKNLVVPPLLKERRCITIVTSEIKSNQIIRSQTPEKRLGIVINYYYYYYYYYCYYY